MGTDEVTLAVGGEAKTPSILIITGIFPPDIGGPATYVPFIAERLAARGHEVEVITSSEPRDMKHPSSSYPFMLIRLPRRINKLRRTLLIIRTIIREGRNRDVLFVNGFHFEAALANIFLRKPCVMKVVGDIAWEPAYGRWTDLGFLDFQEKRENLFLEALKFLRNWTLKRADMVILPSRFLRDAALGWGVKKDRCRIIYNASVEDGENSNRKGGRRDGGGALKVISVGRLIHVKNFDKAIWAVARVPEVRLTIVGEGPLEGEIRRMIVELGLTGRVELIGKLPPQKLRELMREQDVLMLVSSHEGFPHVILEAMREGLATIATGVGGIPEVIRDSENGILVKSEVDSIEKALRRLAGDAAFLRALSRNAERDAVENFGPEAMINKTQALILEIHAARHDKHGTPTR